MNGEKQNFPNTSRNSEIGKLIREARKRFSLAEEIARKFMLACVLEPLADKKGCTTRFEDIKDSKRLELFMAAAVNSGFAIKHFVEYVEARMAIEGSYEFLVEAVVASKFNRYYGKINQGILEEVFPIIAAQIIFYEEVRDQPFELLAKASALLKQTSAADVENLVRAKIIANKISGVEEKYPVRVHEVGNVFDYYTRELAIEEKEGSLTSVLHNRQFVDGFTDIREMLEAMNHSTVERLVDKVAEAYVYIRKKYSEHIGVGLAADYCAICLYVYLSLLEHREAIK
jgi:triphosphoribosyl-dephospho-CoA synthetase